MAENAEPPDRHSYFMGIAMVVRESGLQGTEGGAVIVIEDRIVSPDKTGRQPRGNFIGRTRDVKALEVPPWPLLESPQIGAFAA
jgi:hypothetical protein